MTSSPSVVQLLCSFAMASVAGSPQLHPYLYTRLLVLDSCLLAMPCIVYSFPSLFTAPFIVTQLILVAFSRPYMLFFGKLLAHSGYVPKLCSPILLMKSQVQTSSLMRFSMFFSYFLPVPLHFPLPTTDTTLYKHQIITLYFPIFLQPTILHLSPHTTTYIPTILLFACHSQPSIYQSPPQISTIKPPILFPYYFPFFFL
jgi:hypothetical protein